MKGKPNPRRAELRELSAAIRPLVKAGVYATVNEGLIEHYSTITGASEWKTFKQWIDSGHCVRKGEAGFPVWAQPRKLKAGEAPQDQPADVSGADDTGPEWFPVCYLFHAGQVQPIEERAAA